MTITHQNRKTGKTFRAKMKALQLASEQERNVIYITYSSRLANEIYRDVCEILKSQISSDFYTCNNNFSYVHFKNNSYVSFCGVDGIIDPLNIEFISKRIVIWDICDDDEQYDRQLKILLDNPNCHIIFV